MRMKTRRWLNYRLQLNLSRVRVEGCAAEKRVVHFKNGEIIKLPGLSAEQRASGDVLSKNLLDICCPEHYYTSCLNEISIEMPSVMDAFSYGKEWVYFASDPHFREVLEDSKVPYKRLEWQALMWFTDVLSKGLRYYYADATPWMLGTSTWRLRLGIDGPAEEMLAAY